MPPITVETNFRVYRMKVAKFGHEPQIVLEGLGGQYNDQLYINYNDWPKVKQAIDQLDRRWQAAREEYRQRGGRSMETVLAPNNTQPSKQPTPHAGAKVQAAEVYDENAQAAAHMAEIAASGGIQPQEALGEGVSIG